ncbi:MAG: UDP-N-acetylmuramoyl-L-alanine--D-glutamate ligase [Erysipelotrichaceae bacterium]|nr:UDP-N-acetylmuramoyl-L-alanine--D-glutamate ligase [Erysipelotrichaceae bacterium]MDY5252463.1 UDP-N-acetylmuramoyl-L-alanine--D-glutamate ligase [Erysipelotrichaceae bacterium]
MIKRLLPAFKDKKVLIWGLGKEGISTYQTIRQLLPQQTLYLCDQKVAADAYEHCIVVKQDDLCLDDYDIVMKAPGIVCPYHPNISGQAPLFLHYFKEQIIGITGTKGKSTTSTLTYEILKAHDPNTFLVGNIGLPCFEILGQMDQNSKIVFELGCHQLEFAKDSPHIGVILNIFEEHLDHYETFENYYQTKINCVRYQHPNDLALINKDIAFEAKAKTVLLGQDIYNIHNKLFFASQQLEVVDTKLIGDHNYYNMAIAAYIAKLYDVDDQTILGAIASFKPLAHRLEVIGTYNGVTYVDDAISTINEACIQAITSLKDVKTVLIGGLDRGIDYHKLEVFLNEAEVENIILMYASGARIYQEMQGSKAFAKCHLVDDLAAACQLAIKLTSNGICLLSPAAASYDHFKNFEEKGQRFKELIISYHEV